MCKWYDTILREIIDRSRKLPCRDYINKSLWQYQTVEATSTLLDGIRVKPVLTNALLKVYPCFYICDTRQPMAFSYNILVRGWLNATQNGLSFFTFLASASCLASSASNSGACNLYKEHARMLCESFSKSNQSLCWHVYERVSVPKSLSVFLSSRYCGNNSYMYMNHGLIETGKYHWSCTHSAWALAYSSLCISVIRLMMRSFANPRLSSTIESSKFEPPTSAWVMMYENSVNGSAAPAPSNRTCVLIVLLSVLLCSMGRATQRCKNTNNTHPTM